MRGGKYDQRRVIEYTSFLGRKSLIVIHVV